MRTFKLDNLYATEEKEFLPNDGVKEGEGLMLSVNLDLLTLDYIDTTGYKKFD